jgi:hypothetical protein
MSALERATTLLFPPYPFLRDIGTGKVKDECDGLKPKAIIT